MAKVTRRRVIGILEAKGFSSAETTAGGRVACIFSGFVVTTFAAAAGTLEIYHTQPHGKGPPADKMAQSYLAALTAAGIECHLAEDGRTVVVEVEQERSV